MSGTLFSNVKKPMIPEDKKNYYTMMYYGATIYTRTKDIMLLIFV